MIVQPRIRPTSTIRSNCVGSSIPRKKYSNPQYAPAKKLAKENVMTATIHQYVTLVSLLPTPCQRSRSPRGPALVATRPSFHPLHLRDAPHHERRHDQSHHDPPLIGYRIQIHPVRRPQREGQPTGFPAEPISSDAGASFPLSCHSRAGQHPIRSASSAPRRSR
jgi:hypothetical protein